jgi:hypothetical protein
MTKPNINPPGTMGKMPVGILSNFDGNFSSNFAGKKNVREVSSLCFGEDCDDEADVPESGW